MLLWDKHPSNGNMHMIASKIIMFYDKKANISKTILKYFL